MTMLAPSAAVRAEDLLAKPRSGRLRLHLPAAALRTPRIRVRRRDRRRPRGGRPARRALRIRRGDDGVRRARDHRSSSGARPACSSGCAPRPCRRPSTSLRGPALDADDVRAAVGRAARARRARIRREHARELARLRRRDRARRRLVRGARLRRRLAHPLGRGRLGGRQRRDPADGVPLGLVRPDEPISRRRCRRSPTFSRSPTSSTS